MSVLQAAHRKPVRSIAEAPERLTVTRAQHPEPRARAIALGSRPEVGVRAQIDERTVVVAVTRR